VIAFLFSHWGILLEPDEIGVMENVLLNSDGSIEKFDDGLPMLFAGKCAHPSPPPDKQD
jgi:hypothetical protein